MNLLVASGVVAFAMAWAIGAQDVSNALGTSVGSKALTVRQAIVVGAVFEFLGSLMGGAVATTISQGVISPFVLQDNVLYVQIMFATLAGAFIWLAFATYFSLPVSTTHSMIGSLIGLGLVFVPVDKVNTSTLKTIVMSWVTSPLIGFVVAYSIFSVIYHRVLTDKQPNIQALNLLPHFYSFTFGILTLFLTTNGPVVIRLPMDQSLWFTAFVALLFNVVVRQFVVNPQLVPPSALAAAAASDSSTQLLDRVRVVEVKEQVTGDAGLVDATAEISTKPSDASKSLDNKRQIEQAERQFMSLMVVTACVVAFAHGSNDVSNSVGPFAAIINVYFPPDDPAQIGTPTYILILGGVGIVVGLATYGHKVMATVGEKITKLTFTRGFAAQIGTASTVLTATLMGLSVSTTHCLIGAVTGVGMVESAGKLNKATIKKIILSWVITMPASAVGSILVMMLVKFSHDETNVVRLHPESSAAAAAALEPVATALLR